jgi:hypothetical protein
MLNAVQPHSHRKMPAHSTWFPLKVCLGLAALLAATSLPSAQERDPAFDSTVPHPSFTSAHPRLMIDNGHFNARTPVGRNIDETFSALFKNDGYEIVHNDQRFAPDTVKDAKILVIASASGGTSYALAGNPAFTAEEVDHLASWVRRGGSLLLLFDHFPIAAAAERLTKAFGVEIELGLASDADHDVSPAGCPICSHGWVEYSRKNGLLGDHAITRGRDASERINRIVTFGGSSLSTSNGEGEFLRLGPAATNVQYNNGAPPGQTARRAQAAAFRFGEGRVVMLADTNTVAAQVAEVTPGSQMRTGMGYAGVDNRQLLLNIVHWLSGLLD